MLKVLSRQNGQLHPGKSAFKTVLKLTVLFIQKVSEHEHSFNTSNQRRLQNYCVKARVSVMFNCDFCKSGKFLLCFSVLS